MAELRQNSCLPRERFPDEAGSEEEPGEGWGGGGRLGRVHLVQETIDNMCQNAAVRLRQIKISSSLQLPVHLHILQK